MARLKCSKAKRTGQTLWFGRSQLISSTFFGRGLNVQVVTTEIHRFAYARALTNETVLN